MTHYTIPILTNSNLLIYSNLLDLLSLSLSSAVPPAQPHSWWHLAVTFLLMFYTDKHNTVVPQSSKVAKKFRQV